MKIENIKNNGINKIETLEKSPLEVAVIGCGNRARVYTSLMAEQPEHFKLVAAADPKKNRVMKIANLSNNPQFRCFDSWEALLNEEKLADVLMVSTMDQDHYIPALEAMRKGYDLILEKPMSNRAFEIIQLEKTASEFNRRVIVCHVLRYTSFYKKLKEIIHGGLLGDVVTMNANEGIEPWHFAHSYVRGHWAVMAETSPTIVAKCCHDMDLLTWLLDRPCEHVSSFGELSFFKKENKHLREDYPMFDYSRYLEPSNKGWLAQVYDNPESPAEDILDWLKGSKWGKDVFSCNNTAIDHQVVGLQFEGGLTATFTMTAFAEGRNYEVHGTKASMYAGDFYKEHVGADIIIKNHETKKAEKISVVDENGHPVFGDYHRGGDVGFIKDLYGMLTSEEAPPTSITASVHSHIMAFAAEEARKLGMVINIRKYQEAKGRRVHALD